MRSDVNPGSAAMAEWRARLGGYAGTAQEGQHPRHARAAYWRSAQRNGEIPPWWTTQKPQRA